MSHDDPDITIAKVYFPDEETIQVHQSRVCICPAGFPAGYYWYGSKCHSDGTLLRWIQHFLVDQSSDVMTPDGPQTQPELSSPTAQEQDVDSEPEETPNHITSSYKLEAGRWLVIMLVAA